MYGGDLLVSDIDTSKEPPQECVETFERHLRGFTFQYRFFIAIFMCCVILGLMETQPYILIIAAIDLYEAFN